MDSLRIDTGVIRLSINDDESRVIEFNPEDVVFVEKFYRLIKSFEEKEVEYRTRSEEIEKETGLDSYGMPVNTTKRIELMNDLCDYMRGQIDGVFGDGTSQTVFGDTKTLNMFEQFYSGLMPFINKARSKKMDKYRKTG
jgi:hypothetical protein